LKSTVKEELERDDGFQSFGPEQSFKTDAGVTGERFTDVSHDSVGVNFVLADGGVGIHARLVAPPEKVGDDLADAEFIVESILVAP
jgi:hypothetical protein